MLIARVRYPLVRLLTPFLMALPTPSMAQSPGATCGTMTGDGWRRSEQVAHIPADRSRLQVEQALLARARQAVVDEASGIRVAGTTVRSRAETMVGGRSAAYSDVYLEMFSQSTEGRIVDERPPCVMRTGTDSLRLVLLAKVEVEREPPAAGFQAEVRTNQPAYFHGDPIEVSVSANQPARVFLFAVTPDGAATLFFPNRYDTLNLVRPGEDRYVPARGTAPYSLVAELNPQLGSPHAEMVLAFFYRGEGVAPFSVRDAFARSFTLAEVNRVLIDVPRRHRLERMAGYEIRATGGR